LDANMVVDGSPLRNFLFAFNHASEYESVNARERF